MSFSRAASRMALRSAFVMPGVALGFTLVHLRVALRFAFVLLRVAFRATLRSTPRIIFSTHYYNLYH